MLDSPRLRSGCVHCALIAVAIQGLTPDPQDVTSGSISWILQTIVDDGIPSTADAARSADAAAEEKPDEVCTPVSAAVRLVCRHCIDGPHPPHRMIPSPRPAPNGHQRLPYSREVASTVRRFASLCRYTC